jgi:hypothetical protein
MDFNCTVANADDQSITVSHARMPCCCWTGVYIEAMGGWYFFSCCPLALLGCESKVLLLLLLHDLIPRLR